MPNDSIIQQVEQAKKAAKRTIANICWAQWSTLGFMAGGMKNASGEAFIDPEVLLLLTLDAVETEPRLDQALSWWANVGADLMSLPRLESIRTTFPDDLDEHLTEFAARAVGAGATSSAWKRIAKGRKVEPPKRKKGVSDTGTGLSMVERPVLTSPAAAMLRVRALSGVGAKADVLTFLAARSERSAPVKVIEKALGYSYVPIRRATDDLVAAGLAQTEKRPTSSTGRDPIRFSYRPGTLDLGDVPPWRFWPQIGAFLLRTARWTDGLPDAPSTYMLSSRAREIGGLVDAFTTEHPLPDSFHIPDPRDFSGEAYLNAFLETVAMVAQWIDAGLPSRTQTLDRPAADDSKQPKSITRITPRNTDLNMDEYLSSLEATLKTGDATEHSYRPAMQKLLEDAGLSALGRPPSVVNEPRRTRVGAPDFVIRFVGAPIGYMEAKDIGVELDAETDQLQRYRAGLRNLLFTDGLTFRWFVDGTERDSVTLATEEGKGRSAKLKKISGADDALSELLGAFFRFEAPALTTPRELATQMAATTQMLRDAIQKSFTAEEERGSLHQQLEAFREVLLQGLDEERFADMYAQTLAYGLFAARAAEPEAHEFSRLIAGGFLPRTNPFLQRLFHEVAGPGLDERIAWLVDDLAELLRRTDMVRILKDFGKRTRQEDAVVHFYETFLQAYDPALRELRGVYYTPEPVVNYLVRSVDAILERDFGLARGLADDSKVDVALPDPSGEEATTRTETFHRVQVLDPAAGTGTFLHSVLRAIHKRFEGNEGLWDDYVARHLLPRVHGFEILMAPYTVAHLKLGLFLQETGYTFSSDERLSFFLTNALDTGGKSGEITIPFARWLAEEADAADRVKRDVPVMVVLGNPPYSGHSANTGEWITDLMHGKNTLTGTSTEDYFEVDGGPLGERNPKWLNDDYVKFIRMAQEQVVQTGQGIVAFVTNHGFLDNPTFRGMRQSLMTAFDQIHVLDLHGNAKKKERAPGGGKDDNVFDIMQGVSINVLVRLPDHNANEPAEVYHAELYGPRTDKYEALDAADATTTAWERIDPQTPRYLFQPQDRELRGEYDKGWPVPDIFPVNSVGIVTARDALTIQFSEEDAWDTVQQFAALPPEEAREAFDLRKDSQDWKVEWAQKDLKQSGPVKEKLRQILYRPFDERSTYYTGTSSGFHCRTRWDVTRHMLEGENLGLVSARSNKSPNPDHFFVSATPTEAKAGESTTQSYLFPLWLYPEQNADLFSAENQERKANLAFEFVAALEEATGLSYTGTSPPRRGEIPTESGEGGDQFTPEDAFYYIYGVFHAPTFRSRYADFLRTDYPRAPLPPNAEAFHALASEGKKLVELHLLWNVPEPSIKFPVKGTNEIERRHPKYVPPGGEDSNGDLVAVGRVYINASQFIEGIEPEVWEHEVGGYQVLDKWLKDRGKANRTLTYEDITRYGQIVSALRETQRIMAEVDDIAREAFGW